MPTSAPPSNRFERRRAATRQALIRAARQILAESGDTGVSIQAIADRADVGFGSFYNHFESKAALFDEAVLDALDEYGRAIDERLEGIDDPAERVAFGVRLSAGMAETHPEIMRILRHRGLGHIHSDRGLSPRALGDLTTGAASGRFTFTDPEIALSALGGSLLALLDLRLTRPDADSDATARGMAEMMLRMLGVPPDEAREIAGRPIPASD
ncbi:putative TetR-family transcriptional regulator [Streptomyces spinoverrucosus]|uniref:Putative TetR-family transcriptional regulator n=1 Tax=Streptomyces spinoverrucosus TaxID=284043 RepID=A0A4Y3VB78_9ACTN|nr:TetR/AcrR family transcriptional regulator [Streptomyces spinoverrucosus]GEC03623.1 putative TetR-family transcriptional regulator [Streptomyces spinoverrucosus]GHB51249.1 putative TetR-family transcriptional regulator [Streptomyces spinoverrucosus]